MVSLLKDISLFSGIDDESLKYLERVAVKKAFPKNTILFTKGDETDSLYIITSGNVKTIIIDEEGKEMILSTQGSGEYFGEMSLIDKEPRSATIMTKTSTQMLIIHRDDFQKVFNSNPDMVYSLFKILLKRLRKSTEKVESLAFKDVYGRIASLLTQLAKPENDKWVIEDKLTHMEIAHMVGCSREMVSKILKELTIGGYISTVKKQITIHKKLPSIF
jgi:CRP/FNR family transcriptional regulator, cyclic AMP receptor protein